MCIAESILMKPPGARKIQVTAGSQNPGWISWVRSIEKHHLSVQIKCYKPFSVSTSYKWKRGDEVWFENRRSVHVNNFKWPTRMSKISTAARLNLANAAKSFPEATVITLWSEVGIENRHIMVIYGLRNDRSLRNYNSRPSHFQLRQRSDTFLRSTFG